MIPPTTHNSFANELNLYIFDKNPTTLRDTTYVSDDKEHPNIYIDLESIQLSSASSIAIPAKSAVNDLPDELLVEIFIACREEEGIEIGKKDFIYRLTEVNKRWRGVVLRESRLWSKFILRLEERYQPELAEKTRALLRRSGNSLLTFILETAPRDVSYHEERVRRRECIMQELARHSERWQNVTFRGLLMFGFANALKEAKGKLGQLKTATFTIRPTGPTITIFETAPMLSGLTFLNFGDPKLHLSLPWVQITRLSMGPSSFLMGGFIDILRRCPRLQELEWSGDSSVTIANDPLRLPYLQVLRIATGILYLGKMLDAIAAPSLTTLDITLDRAVEYGQDELAESIILFLLRSCCAVTTLSLGSLLAESVVKILTEHPIIENLEIKSLIFTPYVEAQLMWLGHGIPCIAPNLLSLAMCDCFITCSELEKIIRSRVAGRCATCVIRGKEDEVCKVVGLRRVSLRGVQYYDKTRSRAEGKLLHRFGNQPGLEFTIG